MKRSYQFFNSFASGGHRWQFALIVFLLLVLGAYTFTHVYYQDEYGKEYVKLNNPQLEIIHTHIMDASDSNDRASNRQDSTYKDSGSMSHRIQHSGKHVFSSKRDEFLINYLQTEYNQKIDSGYLSNFEKLVACHQDKDLFSFLSKTRILIRGPFWLTGNMIYLEAFFWSVFGVLVSLIYYVSLANAKGSNLAGSDAADAFNPNEVPGQIAKMFYAPACTIVILLGYHIFTISDNMVDISVNKSLLVFSFIAGFYSSRLMKFMDRLKDLVLPAGATPNIADAAAPKPAKLSLKLKLDEALSKARQDLAKKIADAGYNAAQIHITPKAGGESLKPKPVGTGQVVEFLAADVKPGVYEIMAMLAVTMDDASIVNLKGQKELTITSGDNSLELSMLEDGSQG